MKEIRKDVFEYSTEDDSDNDLKERAAHRKNIVPIPQPRLSILARVKKYILTNYLLSPEQYEQLQITSHVKVNRTRKDPALYNTYKYYLKPNWIKRGVFYKMASAGDTQLFDESFTITNKDNQKYDRVARFYATSADSQTVMTLDINTELYPCQIGETLHCVLASSLSLDGTKDDGKGWRDVGRNINGAEPTLADMFDYVCHGKIYKFEDGEDGQTM